MAETTIEVQRREGVGKSENRRLRRTDSIPAVLYGAGKEPVSIQVPKRTLLELFKSGGHENRIFVLKLAGTDQNRHAMIRDLQLDDMSGLNVVQELKDVGAPVPFVIVSGFLTTEMVVEAMRLGEG